MTGYVKSAFELYRNYDGNNGTFGNVSVYSRTSRNDSSSVYASTPDGNTAELHLIVLNKSYATAISGNFAIQNNRPYTHAEMWYFDKNSNQIVKSNVAINITNNTFTYSIPAASACHFVLKALPTVASFTPASGAVGDTVTITGQNLANVSAITFNNTAVTYFSAISSTQLKVAVPDGATTGLIKITSPAGSGVSASGFTVTTPVVYVSAEGSDSNTGCLSDRPKLTVQAAVNAVDENGTVRIGAGSYNEMVVVGKNMTLLPSGNTSLRSLVMNGAGKTLTIGGELGISGVLRLESGTVASNGNLTLLSTATQTAIIDDFSTGYTGTIMGTITAQRYLPGMQPGYRYLASPVTGATIAQFGSPVNISYYDESRVSGNVSIDAGWVTIETPSTVTSAFTGYSAMMNSGNTTLSLTGTANTGVFTATVTRTASPATTPNGGYNVLGNPYPSPISWAALWNLNNDASIHKAVYVWNPALNKSAVYNFATGLSANGGTNQVASGQAFRIRRNTQGSSLFTINNTTRRDTLSNSRFLREEPIAKVDELLRLNLSSPGDKTGYETVIHSAAGATEGIDADFDAELIAEPGTAQLYSRTGEAAMMLNALPSLNEERMVLLGVRIAEPGLYTIAATEIAGFSAGSKIYLEDRKLGVTQDLSEKPVYRVSLNQSEADRFVLHFGAAGRTESTIAVQIYSENSDVLVQVSGETAAGRVEVIDLLGHTVATAELTAGQQSARVKVEGADGVYLVRFRHEKGTTVRKVVIIRN